MDRTKLSYRIGCRLALLLALGVTLLMQPLPARAETITVTNTLDSGVGSLRDAIAAAAPGDTIVFAPALSGQTIVLASQLTIDKALTLDGAALTEPLKISGNHSVRVFYITANATLTRLDIINGRTISGGGGIHNEAATLTLYGCNVRNNTAENSSGGGLYNNNGTITIRQSVIRDNQATGSTAVGGGIVNWGTMQVISSTIAGNTAVAGGGIRNHGSLTITASTLSGNTAAYAGGIANLGTLTLANCTLSGNAATHGTYTGSALYQWGHSSYSTMIHHCTIANNTAAGSHQAAVELEDGVITLKNSLIADNGGNFYVWGNAGTDLVSQGYNLADTWNGLPLATGDLTADPLLDTLADNGGPTLTHALLPGSPARDAANPVVSLTTDQRGIPRPWDGDDDGNARSDIGAFEANPPLITLIKSVAPAADVPYHSVVTYTLVLNNATSFTDPTVILTDTLPAEVDFARWVENPGAGVTDDQITWSGVLTAHTALTFTFQVTQTGGYGATIVNTAAASSATGLANAMASFTVSGPQLGLSKSAAPATAPFHGILTYTLVLSNSGDIADPTVVLTDTLPAEVTFARWVENHGAVVNSDRLTWSGSLAACTALTFTFQVTHTGAYPQPLLNLAEWSGSTRTGQATATVSIGCVPTYTVQSAADAGVGSLRQALADVCAGGVIDFAPILAGQTITLTSQLDVPKSVTIDGRSLNTPVRISGGDTTRLFYIYNGVPVTLTGIDLVRGYATSGGAAITNDGLLTLSHAQVTDHRGTSAIYNTSFLTLTHITVARSGNSGREGGGLYNLYRATVLSSTLADNTAQTGGAIYSIHTLTLRDSVISGNRAVYTGGGVYINGSANISRCDVRANGAGIAGGGVALNSGSATVSESILRNNSAAGSAAGGGGLSNLGNLTVLSSTISGNTANAYAGGGAFNDYPGELIVWSSTFSGNTARYGGAIGNKATLRLTNSTLSGNVSTDGTWGSSALDLWYSNSTEINHCTIVSNTAQANPIPSGILLEAGSLILRNSIVAYNNTDFNFRWYDGMFSSQGYNLSNAWNGLPTTTGDLTGDPRLAPLADNGPATGLWPAPQTHALLPGSPALDAANPVLSLTTDQRGLPRPQGIAADIGAFERGWLALTKTVTPTLNAPYHGPVTYTLTLSNDGASDAPGVWLRDALPESVTFARWVENHGASVANDTITWNGTLTATTALAFTFVATHTGAHGETVTNTAALGDAHQQVLAAAGLTVERPQLAVSKTVAPLLAPRHGVVTYTLVLSNSGIAADPAVVLTDTLPAEVDFARWVGDVHGAVVTNDQIAWTGSLAAHTALTFTFQVTHTGDYGETVVNTADWRGSIQTGQAVVSFTVACGAALTVTNTADEGPGSLRNAVSGVCPDGVVTFAPALAGETIYLSREIVLDKPVTIDGSGPSARVNLSGNGATRLFALKDTAVVTMTQLSLTEGYAVYHPRYLYYGGAIYNAGVLTLREMLFTNNSAADSGGAVYSAYGSRLWVDTSEFYHNAAGEDGGALYVYFNNTVAAVTDSIFMNNNAKNGGAMTSQGAALTVTHSSIAENYSTSNGGGLYMYEGVVTLVDCTLTGNQASYGGGFYGFGSTVSLTNTQILTNTASGYGGAGFSSEGQLTIAHSVIGGNTSADLAGGPLLRAGHATISDSTLRDNRTDPVTGRMGGAIYNTDGDVLTVTHSAFTGNQAKTNGGGIYNVTAPLTVQAGDFIGNTANEGGALYSYNAPLSVSDSAFYSNTAYTNGGGLRLAGGSTSITTSVVASNTAASGAGLYNEGGGLNLANSTVSSNTATLSGGGLVNNLGDLTLRHVTLADNRAPIGGGLINMGDTLYAYNSLLAHNSGGDCDNTSFPGVIAANIHNLIADGSCNENAVGLLTGDPRLAPLTGGLHALRPDSPAIDAGDLAYCLPTDQRGVVRPQGAACDIGAFEATSRLRMNKTVTPSVVAPGQAITFTLTLSNDGSIPASGIVVTDTLPSFLKNVSLSSNLLVTNTGHTPPYVWMVQDLAPGRSGVITISGVLARPLAAGTYTNTAIIAAAGDLTAENNAAVITLTVLNIAPAFTSAPVTTATQEVSYVCTTTAMDDNGDALTLTASTLPAWLTLTDHGDGTATLSGTPGSTDVGDHLVVLRVTDGEGLFDTQSFTLTVAAKSHYTIFLPLVVRNRPTGAGR